MLMWRFTSARPSCAIVPISTGTFAFSPLRHRSARPLGTVTLSVTGMKVTCVADMASMRSSAETARKQDSWLSVPLHPTARATAS